MLGEQMLDGEGDTAAAGEEARVDGQGQRLIDAARFDHGLSPNDGR